MKNDASEPIGAFTLAIVNTSTFAVNAHVFVRRRSATRSTTCWARHRDGCRCGPPGGRPYVSAAYAPTTVRRRSYGVQLAQFVPRVRRCASVGTTAEIPAPGWRADWSHMAVTASSVGETRLDFPPHVNVCKCTAHPRTRPTVMRPRGTAYTAVDEIPVLERAITSAAGADIQRFGR